MMKNKLESLAYTVIVFICYYILTGYISISIISVFISVIFITVCFLSKKIYRKEGNKQRKNLAKNEYFLAFFFDFGITSFVVGCTVVLFLSNTGIKNLVLLLVLYYLSFLNLYYPSFGCLKFNVGLCTHNKGWKIFLSNLLYLCVYALFFLLFFVKPIISVSLFVAFHVFDVVFRLVKTKSFVQTLLKIDVIKL